ncbi:translation initiation factor IF-2 [Novosphingobium sp.]|uniref:translation initiation factor IF-2 n=1 Tax=Novosphingobium sp. TaxID=1874826 RepID=UPI0022C8BE13|nr:translation initiation factor IF-2 [Novosphingobium sp.]MCZ8019895.1 translation initiation factor IF-2 [Novosphingobium sp.]MCZ8035779.1 translation initiation factor IF-2 [Novosphingobium sp.]MCZ8052656.1 translation initiation factor IF-2 [Novosphingobium sp.]MCZ8060760.1 translation initiation factor IF-2 [Novosphingobium sp.]MCZ8233332.1 translation initiation factor IF-2 [Novosphingobium sp.]
MSDSDNKPTLGRKPLGLKKSVEAGEVKQTFSHGRTNKVVVEVKSRKLIRKPGEAPVAAPPPPPPPAPVAAPAPAPAPKKPAAPAGETPQERVARLQREAEEARLAMLEEQTRREQEERQRALDEERRRAEQNRKAEAEAEAAATLQPEPEAATEAPPADEAGDDEEAQRPAGTAAPAPRRFTPVAAPKRPEPAAKKPAHPTRDRKGGDERRSGKLTVTRALNEDEGARARSLAALKRAREKEKRAHFAGQSAPREKQVRDVVVPEAITVQELANRMAEKGADLVKALFKMGMMVTVNQTIDQDTAELLVEEFGHNIQRVSESDVDIDTTGDVDAPETLKPRPPVVTIMGHVDHGKTSLLDALRGTDVVRGEAGGITQHIGAYQIKTKGGDLVTFLDTPGHEAFTEMRMRGANVTDIVVLVVAGDDGIMPQTIEAINHTKAAGVPMIVAITKADRSEYSAQKIRERLLEHEIVVEAMSGDVQDVEVSAKTGAGLDTLIEKILLQAELLELKANPERSAEATVVEAKLDKGKGPLATVLITRGTLKVGDIFVVGTHSGRVRAMLDDKGRQIKEAPPALPVEVLGLGGVPMAGDVLTVVESEARAREVAAFRQEKATAKRTTTAPSSLENMFSALSAKQTVIEYPVVVKADVQGSVEAIVNALNKISNDEIKVKILQSGVGAITESDVNLAAASNAPVIGFNVRPNAKARELVDRNKTRMKYFDVIYHLTDDIAKEMAGIWGPERIEHVVGRAEVKEVFPAGKRDKAAGLLVLEGGIKKGLFARLTRQDVIVSKTVIASLRRFKDDVPEVRAGLECGVVLQDTNDIKPGDMLEVFEVEERERTL